MARERRSLQDRIRERQRSGFTGRQGQVMQYQENLALPVDDERRRFLFNIHGNAGVGKTFLARQLQQVAAGVGAVTAYADETAEDVAAVMSVVAASSAAAGPGWASSTSASPSTSSAAMSWNLTRTRRMALPRF